MEPNAECDDASQAKTLMQFIVKYLLEYTARPENKALLQGKLLDPLIQYMGGRLWPYIVGAGLYMAVVTILLLAICYFAIKKK